MFAIQSQAPSSSLRLLQCGYRSKVCTNPRATKIDGSLHKLCEFHRRKANLSQQRLHQRKREARQRTEAATEAPLGPIPYAAADAVAADKYSGGCYSGEPTPSGFTRVEMSMLELFLEPLPTERPDKYPPNSAVSADSTNSIII
jgi:hypothetical protein